MFPVAHRRLRAAVVVVAVALGLVALAPTPAHAATTWTHLNDNLETNPYSRWWFENPDSGSHGDFEPNNGVARSGVRYANVWHIGAGGWNSVDISLWVAPPRVFRKCTATAWFQAVDTPRAIIEIINPATWSYVATRQITVPSPVIWSKFSLTWTGGPQNIVLRFVLLADETDGFSQIKVEDVLVQCVTLP